MLYKVIRTFRNVSGVQLLPGDTVELDPARAARLRALGLVGMMPIEQATAPATERAVKPKPERAVAEPPENRKRATGKDK